jgi:hypothetical protein
MRARNVNANFRINFCRLLFLFSCCRFEFLTNFRILRRAHPFRFGPFSIFL